MTLRDPGCLQGSRLPCSEEFWSFIVDLNINGGIVGALPADVLVRSDIDASSPRVVVARLLASSVIGSLSLIAVVVASLIVLAVLGAGPPATLHIKRHIAIKVRAASP